MKYFYILILPGLLLFGSVNAQNSASDSVKRIELQENPHAISEVIIQDANGLKVTQSGQNNVVKINHSGVGQPKRGHWSLDVNDSAGNRIVISDSSKNGLHPATDSSRIIITQMGAGNQATVTQTGKRNQVAISQTPEKPKD